MKIGAQLTYRASKNWRPQATILQEESIGLLGICFSWGEVDLSEKIFENVRIFTEAALNGSEITNPFGYDSSLSSLENALRAGLSLANDVTYRLINKSSLSAGAECVFFIKNARELAVGQLGQPHVLLHRQGKVIPLITALDLLPKHLDTGSFLPGKLLGVNPSCQPVIRSLHLEVDDELLLFAHSLLPSCLFRLENSLTENPDQLKLHFQDVARELPDNPFWISVVRPYSK